MAPGMCKPTCISRSILCLIIRTEQSHERHLNLTDMYDDFIQLQWNNQ